MDTVQSVLRSAKHFFAGTFLSRVSGLMRDMAMAFCFGSAPEIAAFMVAYRLANLFRRLLGEGNLQAGFAPHFESLRVEGEKRAALFYRDTFFSLGILLFALVLALEGVLWGCRHGLSSDWREMVELSMWMTPGLFFICLYALSSALLQCQRNYFLPAVAPIFFNAIWIFAVLLVCHLPRGEAVKWLSLGITGAFAVQWIAVVREERKWVRRFLSLREWLKPHLFSPDWKALVKPLSLGILGVGAVQLNSAFDAVFARLADPAGPAFLWYAIRIQQLPLALFGIALSGALLPPLSRAIRQGALPLYRYLLQSALQSGMALILPCTFGILVLGGAGVNLLYGRGDFSAADVQETLYCLWGYGLGLVPSIFVLLLANGFYAQKSYRIPTLISLGCVGGNIALNALFVFAFHWGAISIAIATSLSAFLNAALLAKGLRNKVGEVFTSSFWRFFGKMFLGCALPAAIAFAIGTSYPRDFLSQLLQFSGLAAVYGSGVLAMMKLLKIDQFFALFERRNRPQREKPSVEKF